MDYGKVYEINTFGSVRRIDTHKTIKPFYKKKNKRNYYLMVSLSKEREKRNKYVHRLVALTFIPRECSSFVVNHKNSNNTDNRVENLEWITQKENLTHQYAAGRHRRGCLHHMYKVVPAIAIAMREDGKTFTEIGKHFNCSYVAVRECLKRYGVFTKTNRSPQVIPEKVITMRKAGSTHKTIREFFNCSSGPIKRILRENNMV